VQINFQDGDHFTPLASKEENPTITSRMGAIPPLTDSFTPFLLLFLLHFFLFLNLSQVFWASLVISFVLKLLP